jgi:hypothetical protein
MVEGGREMSQSRRPGRSVSRPPVENPPAPVPAAGGRAWGYNVDYLVAARLGWLIPQLARRFLGGTDDGRAACREVARRVALPRDRHRGALDFASTFWLVLAFGALGVFALVRHSRQEVPGLAKPKPYDGVISLAAGVLAASAFWAGV